ncbi:MAG TPA: aminotransferase class I/II-fold pyridoxal phosphate-dependent enzyme, partial [Holophaga sp.]|nr:aminotransferase class I/II-fold pyridoxal phosphate-dependent enzyme [Holophaga sp.]
QVICDDISRKLETFAFLDERQAFNAADFERKVRELLGRQDRLVVVLNTPNHNPTGYSLTEADWDEVMAIVDRHARGEKTIALLVDTAYLDYVLDPSASRAFMRKFGRMSPNAIAGFAFSMSKSFTLYGQRTGALIGVSPDREAIGDFVNAATITNRARWSNVSRGAMQAMVEIYRDPARLAQVERERRHYVELLDRRAAVFMEEARAARLDYLPYCGGFFISVPTSEAKAVSDRLNQRNVFTVPLAKGLRIAVCAVSTPKMHGLASAIAEAVHPS